MAAKRIGSVLTNVTGTASQLLRVKSDESGFEFFTPATLPAYTITNDTTDRIIDANDTNLDEVADVLSTLIKDITTVVGGPSAFQWSTSEQVWPFEKDHSGNVLYCKELSIGLLPNTGSLGVSTSPIVADKIVHFSGYAINVASHKSMPLPFPFYLPAFAVSVWHNVDGKIYIDTGNGQWSDMTGYIRLIYSK